MLERLKEVIALANNPTTDQATKKQALDYLEQLKQDPENGTKLFTTLLTEESNNDLNKFVALQFINDIVVSMQNDYNKLDSIKAVMLDFIMQKINNNTNDPEYFKNKVAETFTRLFYYMYGPNFNGNQWNTFFSDLINVFQIQSLLENTIPSNFSLLGLDYFNRICLSINSEIADQTFARPKQIQLKNNDLKDSMRAHDVPILTTIWLNGLKALAPSNTTNSSNKSNSESVSLILACIGAFVSWIEISLIVTPEYIQAIYGYLDFPPTKISCANCLCEIISKKMKPVDKLSLLSMLNLTDKLNLNNPTNGNKNNGSDDEEPDEIELNETFSKLASSVGIEFCIIIDQCNENSSLEGQQIATTADQQIIEQVAPLVLNFMNNDYDSVTEQTFSFINQYLTILKRLFALGGKPGSAVAINSKRQPLDINHEKFLVQLIQICFKKMRIDDSTTEDMVDAIDEFSDTIRSKLKVIQDNIVLINPNLYLENISNNISSALMNLNSNTLNWRDIELAIYQMHNLCESIKNNLFGLNKSDIYHSEPWNRMSKFLLMLMDNTVIFQINNQYIQILFFELIVKHNTFLPNGGNNVKDDIVIINIFCSNFGMFNNVEKVRHRSWYLFSRFIKTIKPKLSTDILNEMIIKLGPLLTIKANLSKSETSTSNNNEIFDLTFDNQLYIFESIGILIGSNSDNNFNIIDSILSPLYQELERCISTQLQTPEIIYQSHHILMSIGTFTRGIHYGIVPENQVNNFLINNHHEENNKLVVNKILIEKISNVAEVVLVTFSFFNKFEIIRDASRFTFSRLIPILNKIIVPFTNKLIILFLESDLKVVEMIDFLSFLGQFVHMFNKEEECFNLFNNLLISIIEKIHLIMDTLINEEKIEATGNISKNNENNDINRSNSNNNTGTPTKNSVVITDSFRDQVLLKKAYFTFLQSFVANNITSILLTERNCKILPLVFKDILDVTPKIIEESSFMKVSLNLLINLLKKIGSGKYTDANDKYKNFIINETIDGLDDYLIMNIVPMIFEIPFNNEYKFNIKDSNSRIIAIDLSKILTELVKQNMDTNNGDIDNNNISNSNVENNRCVKYLIEIYLPGIQFPNDLIMDLVSKLINQNGKSFEKYFIDLITRLKQ
ncbi:hypothetical protein TBLA_0B01940 [Henningerozyma blattae CBS 6284]|uniref:Exportin-T n=1 Tax=Henningerozyma blattae (strain ATCC 34711 / CBS 6284 / DSM 70876 / NBRC 10599 / NRRL Y-10934 / UCD 77-7) TaxID=1071380 RepID=I2GY35_HENB6|nr:hypothetical protein TBLA_0B01940 [Tetrapisispora blattae CBS 6284]CCH59037.1 hypothetical protein TBLA_0B01940 [Tetrapisispora blattae CBS 6284]